jgi:hypothetical protein
MLYNKSREGGGEDTIKRLCAHKSHILKVMFLAAVAHPRFEETTAGGG